MFYVTNASYAHFPYYNVLPMASFNIGGIYSLVPVDDYSGYNLSMLFNPVAQQTYGIPGFVNSPFMTADLGGIRQAGEVMAKPFLDGQYKRDASGIINSTSALIDNAIQAYESKIANADTPADQKTKYQQAVNELKAKKEELQKLNNELDANPGEAYTKSLEIKKAVDKTMREVISGAAEAPAATDSSATGNQPAATDSSATGDQPAATDSATQTGNQPAAADSSATGNQPAAAYSATQTGDAAAQQGGVAAIDDFPMEVLNDTDKVHKAIAGPGTNDGDLEDVIDTYSKNGAMLELMLCYNNKYGEAKGESFIKAFMDDEDHNEACDMLPKIVNSLVARAKAMGIYDDEFRKWEVAVTKEITASDWSFLGLGAVLSSIDDDVVCENIDKMVEKLGEKTGSRYAKIKKDS